MLWIIDLNKKTALRVETISINFVCVNFLSNLCVCVNFRDEDDTHVQIIERILVCRYNASNQSILIDRL